MRFVWRILYPSLFLLASVLLAMFYPLALLIFYAGTFALLIVSRKQNLYRMTMLLKKVEQTICALRAQIRNRIHLGFRDYNNDISADADQELRHRATGYVR